MVLAFGAWALASPVGASPDEDFHLASIWCGSGEREGLCGPGSTADSRMVPDNIERAICYAHEPDVSAACQGKNFLDGEFGLTDSDRVNGDGLYPRVTTSGPRCLPVTTWLSRPCLSASLRRYSSPH
ncbi:DUF2142 domain-containing protein [Leucobacter coleopterorum]